MVLLCWWFRLRLPKSFRYLTATLGKGGLLHPKLDIFSFNEVLFGHSPAEVGFNDLSLIGIVIFFIFFLRFPLNRVKFLCLKPTHITFVGSLPADHARLRLVSKGSVYEYYLCVFISM
jgi:hypothetical protein